MIIVADAAVDVDPETDEEVSVSLFGKSGGMVDVMVICLYKASAS